MGKDLQVRGERPSHAHGRCSLFAGPLEWGHSSIPSKRGQTCWLLASGRHMHMDAARFSPGRWVIVLTRLRAAAHGALLRQHGL